MVFTGISWWGRTQGPCSTTLLCSLEKGSLSEPETCFLGVRRLAVNSGHPPVSILPSAGLQGGHLALTWVLGI